MSPLPFPQVERRGDVTVVVLGPEYELVEESMIETLSASILQAAREADPPWFALDLSRTRFFGSSFIEILFRAYHRLNEKGTGRFALCGLTPHCREVIEITHLDRLWKLYPTAAEAVTALSAPTA